MWPLIKARGSFKRAKMLLMARKPTYEELEKGLRSWRGKPFRVRGRRKS